MAEGWRKEDEGGSEENAEEKEADVLDGEAAARWSTPGERLLWLVM